MPRPKLRFITLFTFWVLFLAVLLGISFGVVVYAYHNTYYPGTRIGKLDVSGKTRSQAKALVAAESKRYLQHQVEIVLPDVSKPLADSPNIYEDLHLLSTLQDLGLAFNEDAAIDAAWKEQHTYSQKSWLASSLKTLFFGQKYEISYLINTDGVRSFIDTKVVPKIGAPVPAKIIIKGSAVSIDPAKPGFEINRTELAKKLVSTVEEATDDQPSFIKAPVSLVESPIQNSTVQPLVDQLNALGDMKITLTANSTVIIPTKEQILSWFVPIIDEKNTLGLTIQKEAITKYLVKYKDLNQTKAQAVVMQSLTPLLASTPSRSLAIALPTIVRPVPADVFTSGKFAGKYVEVNLTTQKMYLVEGTALEKSFQVSSGKWSTPTPVGTYAILSKAPRAYSRAFGLYMPYWQNFLDNEYGLHELPEWPNGYKEGQAHIGTPVSHGCIRLGVGDAKYAYDWTEIGTPVYIHT